MNAFARGALGPAMGSVIRVLSSCGSNPLDPKEAAASSSGVCQRAMVEGPTDSILPEDCSAPMGSLRAWFSFATSTLELKGEVGAILHGCSHLLTIDRLAQLQLGGARGDLGRTHR